MTAISFPGSWAGGPGLAYHAWRVSLCSASATTSPGQTSNFWRIAMDADGGDPGRAVETARDTNPAVIPVPSRQVMFYLDTGRALSRLGKDREAVRMLLVAERTAPQLVRSAKLVAETVRGLLDRVPSSEVRGLAERMSVV